MSITRKSNDAWAVCKIVEEDDDGKLYLLKNNLKYWLNLVKKPNCEEIPITFISFLGSVPRDVSLLTNLFASYVACKGQGWITKLKKEGLDGFALGSQSQCQRKSPDSNPVQHVIKANEKHYLDEAQSGIYFWPEIFILNDENDKHLLMLLHAHHKTGNKRDILAINMLVATICSRIADIGLEKMFVYESVKELVGHQTKYEILQDLLCADVVNIVGVKKPPSNPFSRDFVIFEDGMPTMNLNTSQGTSVNLTSKQIVACRKLAECLTKEGLSTKALDDGKTLLNINTINPFMQQAIDKVNICNGFISDEGPFKSNISKKPWTSKLKGLKERRATNLADRKGFNNDDYKENIFNIETMVSLEIIPQVVKFYNKLMSSILSKNEYVSPSEFWSFTITIFKYLVILYKNIFLDGIRSIDKLECQLTKARDEIFSSYLIKLKKDVRKVNGLIKNQKDKYYHQMDLVVASKNVGIDLKLVEKEHLKLIGVAQKSLIDDLGQNISELEPTGNHKTSLKTHLEKVYRLNYLSNTRPTQSTTQQLEFLTGNETIKLIFATPQRPLSEVPVSSRQEEKSTMEDSQKLFRKEDSISRNTESTIGFSEADPAHRQIDLDNNNPIRKAHDLNQPNLRIVDANAYAKKHFKLLNVSEQSLKKIVLRKTSESDQA